jgi:hypothetical protein
VTGVFIGTVLLHSSIHRPIRWLFAAVAVLLTGALAAYWGALPDWCEIPLRRAVPSAMR